MDPITMSLIGLGVQAGGSLLGELFGSDDEAEARKLREEALADSLGLSVPELRQLVPQLQGRTNMAGVVTDGSLDAIEDEALARTAQVARGGRTATTRAQAEQARMDAAAAERMSRETVKAGAEARGTWGSGMELSAMLDSGQAAADRERMAGVQSAANEEEATLQAIASMGTLAGSRQARQFNQRAAVATAQDRIDQFNTATTNDFTVTNDANRYRQFDANARAVGVRNNARLGAANEAEERGDEQRATVGGIAQGVGYGMGALANHQAGKTPAPAAPSLGGIGASAALNPALSARKRTVR